MSEPRYVADYELRNFLLRCRVLNRTSASLINLAVKRSNSRDPHVYLQRPDGYYITFKHVMGRTFDLTDKRKVVPD